MGKKMEKALNTESANRSSASAVNMNSTSNILDRSTVDSTLVLKGQRNVVFRRQNVMLSKMDKELGRDQRMYSQTDRL